MGLFIEKKDGLNPFLHKVCKEIIVKGSVFFQFNRITCPFPYAPLT